MGNTLFVKARFTRSFLAQLIGLRINYRVRGRGERKEGEGEKKAEEGKGRKGGGEGRGRGSEIERW